MSVKGLLCGLDAADLDPDPIRQFERWFRFAKFARVYMPNAMALASVSREGRPSARMMLLKGFDARGFVFFTNYESRKGQELETHPSASLIVYWPELHRQVRIEGRVERVTKEESDAYFQSRPRGSRLGAWASRQSMALTSRRQLEDQFREVKERFRGQEVPLPPYWGGYRLAPQRIEFWQGRAHRLHDRLCYTRDGERWVIQRLSP